MHKVVYNKCFGGFSLSSEAVQWLAENGSDEIKAIASKHLNERPNNRFGYHIREIMRHDPDLVRCVETLGSKADGGFAELAVYELKGNKYRIDDYDGWENVYEPEDEQYIIIE